MKFPRTPSSWRVTLTKCATVGLGLGLLLLAAPGCKGNSSKTEEKSGGDAASNDTNAMLERMNQAREGEGQTKPAGAPPSVPGLSLEQSPECKALEQEQTTLRQQLEQINTTIVAPAAEKTDQAAADFESCQNDLGCVNSLERYEAKQKAYAFAKNQQDQAEKQVEEIETRLYQISQTMAAKCDNEL